MKKSILIFQFYLILLSLTSLQAQQLKVFDSIPGRNSSEYYLCRVKFVTEPETAWRNANVLQTRSKETSEDPEGAYYDVTNGFTASWIAFESDFIGDNVIVEIAKRDGTPITKAMVRPVGEAQAATISNGKAYVVFTESANINVDINGQMEDNYTGFGYNGPKVHTISLFGNPIFTPPTGADVKVLQPNEDIRTINRTTYPKIIFAPGVHDIGLALPILSNEELYIPGDALLHGTIHPPDLWGNQAAQNFKVYGSGTLSGENIVRAPTDDANIATKPFTHQAEGILLEGFVVVDPAFHTFNMNNSRGVGAQINVYKNLKILAWRINSDGINAFRNSEVYDCFFRVQDDAFYYGAENVNQHDNTVWTDSNGAVLFLQNILDGSSSTFRDVKVIYQRAHWHWWDGGRIVSMRQFRDNRTISNVTVSNILVEDPLPAFPPFYANFDVAATGTNMTLNNIVFENIHQKHDGVVTNLPTGRSKPQNTLKGNANQSWENITFRDCYFNGTTLTSFADGNFYTEFVDANTVIFETTSNIPITGINVDNCPTANLNINDTYQLTTAITPTNATDTSVTWSSSDNSIATVDANGLVTAVGGGSATITATTNDGGFISNCIVNVNGCTDDLPWTDNSFIVSNNTVNYSSGLIDISCATSATLSLDIQGIVNKPNGTNYCNVYYSVDGGTQQAVSLNNGAFALKTVSATGISGSTLEIIINVASSHARNDYFISNLKVEEGQNSSKSLSTKNETIFEGLKIFPNPAKSQTLIKSESIIKNIKVYSLSGKLLSDKELNTKEHKINVSNYAKGLYFLAISNDSGTLLKKLIIQ